MLELRLVITGISIGLLTGVLAGILGKKLFAGKYILRLYFYCLCGFAGGGLAFYLLYTYAPQPVRQETAVKHNITEINNPADFEAQVLTCKIPCMVKFTADWCAPCKQLEPILKQLSEKYRGKVNFFTVNVDSQEAIAIKYGVKSLPTVILFKDGKPQKILEGLHGTNEYEEILSSCVK